MTNDGKEMVNGIVSALEMRAGIVKAKTYADGREASCCHQAVQPGDHVLLIPAFQNGMVLCTAVVHVDHIFDYLDGVRKELTAEEIVALYVH